MIRVRCSRLLFNVTCFIDGCELRAEQGARQRRALRNAGVPCTERRCCWWWLVVYHAAHVFLPVPVLPLVQAVSSMCNLITHPNPSVAKWAQACLDGAIVRQSVFVLCAVCCVLCAVCCVLCAVCCVLCSVCCVLCAVFCVLCSVFCVLCSVCCAVHYCEQDRSPRFCQGGTDADRLVVVIDGIRTTTATTVAAVCGGRCSCGGTRCTTVSTSGTWPLKETSTMTASTPTYVTAYTLDVGARLRLVS
jgi:hypothetical protein